MNDVSADLPLHVLRQIEKACSRLEEPDPSTDECVGAIIAEFEASTNLDESGKQTLRRELLALDIELKVRRGESPVLEDYVVYEDEAFIADVLNSIADSDAAESRPPDGLSRYRFDGIVGRGGLGLVWQVHDRETNRPLAMKMMRPKLRGHTGSCLRLRQEAWLTGMLQHPGVPPVHDVGSLPDGSPYFTMKLIAGQTLTERLKQPGEDTTSDQLAVFEQVAQTIAYVHSQSVIHRDLKPQNVMVGQFGEIQVMDWGLAKKLSPQTQRRHDYSDEPNVEINEQDAALTQSGDVFGTPNYMSPEQARGDVSAVDRRSDVFGLGAILFEILTGCLLYEGRSSAEVIEKCIRADHDEMLERLALPEIPEPMRVLCQNCIDPDPLKRPPDASAVADTMRDYFVAANRSSMKIEAERLSEKKVREEQIKRSRSVAAITSLLAAVSCLAAATVYWQYKRTLRAQEIAERASQRSQLDAGAINQVNDYLNQILTSTWPERRGNDVTLRQVMDDTLPTLDKKFSQQPRVEGFIRRTLGDTYRRLDEFEIADQQLRAALAAYQRVDPTDETEILLTMDRLAENLHFDSSNESLAEAAELRSNILQRRKELLGQSHPDTIRTMDRLAVIMIDQERYEDAEELLHEASELSRSTPKLDDLDRLNIIANLAYTHANMEREDEAEAGYRRVLDDDEVTIEQSIRVLSRLGEVLGYEDRVDEAAANLQESIRVSTDHLGPAHEQTLDGEMKLARLHDSHGEPRKTLSIIETTLPKHIETLDDDSGDVWELRKMKFRNLRQLERHDEAIDVLNHAYEVLREGRPDHRYTREAAKMLKEFGK